MARIKNPQDRDLNFMHAMLNKPQIAQLIIVQI